MSYSFSSNISKLLLLSCLTATLVAQAQIIQNGSFESGMDGWDFNEGVTANDAATWLASKGSFYAELGGGNVAGSQMAQTFPVTGGTRYLLTFDQSLVGDPVAILRATISTPSAGVIAARTDSLSADSISFGQYISRSLAFTVPAGETNATVTFFDESPDDGVAVDPVVDNVVVTELHTPFGVSIYRSSEQIQSTGGHTNSVRKTASYLVMDVPTGDITAVTFGSTPEFKWYQVLPLRDYQTFLVTGANGITNMILSKATSGTNAWGPITMARRIRGTNVRVTLSTGEIATLPRYFTGSFQDLFISAANNETISTTALVSAVYSRRETAISRSAGEGLGSAVARLSARLESRGYTLLPGQLSGAW